MPRLMPLDTETEHVINIPGPGNFKYSAKRIEKLGEPEYTLTTIVCDTSGSVQPFAAELLICLKTIVAACRKSPRSEYLMLRLLTFNNGIYEIHGFKPLNEINEEDDYDDLEPNYTTLLYDATYDAVSATLEYSERLIAKDYDCNGAIYIITDGLDTHSDMTPAAIKDKIVSAIGQETIIESLITVLIGLHDPKLSWHGDVKKKLEDFKNDAELTEFLDVGEATPRKLAKLANWVSESTSSQSQSLNSGGPSQILGF